MAIPRKIKTCTACGESREIYARGMCGFCYQKDRQKVYAERAKNKPKKKNFIKQESDKRAEQLARYRINRDKYMKEHPICEVHDCNKPSTNLHHKKGRDGELVFDTKYFMACCGSCHPRRIHETDTAWAKEKGYLLTRH